MLLGVHNRLEGPISPTRGGGESRSALKSLTGKRCHPGSSACLVVGRTVRQKWAFLGQVPRHLSCGQVMCPPRRPDLGVWDCLHRAAPRPLGVDFKARLGSASPQNSVCGSECGDETTQTRAGCGKSKKGPWLEAIDGVADTPLGVHVPHGPAGIFFNTRGLHHRAVSIWHMQHIQTQHKSIRILKHTISHLLHMCAMICDTQRN